MLDVHHPLTQGNRPQSHTHMFRKFRLFHPYLE
jgi:hypothetical protein